jgi:hypothetical protein
MGKVTQLEPDITLIPPRVIGKITQLEPDITLIPGS